jgi:hypothetical protein
MISVVEVKPHVVYKHPPVEVCLDERVVGCPCAFSGGVFVCVDEE